MTITFEIPDADYSAMVAVQDPTLLEQAGGDDVYMHKLCVSALHQNWKERIGLLIDDKSRAAQLAIALPTSDAPTADTASQSPTN